VKEAMRVLMRRMGFVVATQFLQFLRNI